MKVTGRVLLVRPREDGRFGVTLGPGPDCTWYVTDSPPNLGSEVTVDARGASTRPIEGANGRKGSMTVLIGAKQQILASPYATRVVAPEWVARVEEAMFRPLLGYQVTGSAWLAQRLAAGQGSILADEPGTGKTTQTIAAICATGCFPAIVVCPSSVKLNWEKEIKYAVRRPTVQVVRGRSGPIGQADVSILNYALLKGREQQIQELHPKVIVFDEAHELKEPRAAHSHRASIATRLAAWIRRVILLTGSPLMNNVTELWRLLHMIDPQEWQFFDDFEMRYCKPQEDDTKNAKRIVTARGRAEHLDELQTRVQPLLLRRRKSEVQKDLPSMSRRSVLVDLDENDRAHYVAAERDVVAWLRKFGHDERARKAALTIGLAKLTMLRRIAAIGKMRHAVPEYLKAWFAAPDAQPLVIFAYHRVVLDGLFPLCAHLGLKTVGIGGDEDINARQRAVDTFQEGRAQVFICPIKAGGVGINLHRAADSLILERDWSPKRMSQAEERLHRLGQTRPVVATYLDAARTVDEHVAEVLQAKETLIDHVIDGGAADTEATVTTIGEVMARMAKAHAGQHELPTSQPVATELDE